MYYTANYSGDHGQNYTETSSYYTRNNQSHAENSQNFSDNSQNSSWNTQNYTENSQNYSWNTQDYAENSQNYLQHGQSYPDTGQKCNQNYYIGTQNVGNANFNIKDMKNKELGIEDLKQTTDYSCCCQYSNYNQTNFVVCSVCYPGVNEQSDTRGVKRRTDVKDTRIKKERRGNNHQQTSQSEWKDVDKGCSQGDLT